MKDLISAIQYAKQTTIENIKKIEVSPKFFEEIKKTVNLKYPNDITGRGNSFYGIPLIVNPILYNQDFRLIMYANSVRPIESTKKVVAMKAEGGFERCKNPQE